MAIHRRAAAGARGLYRGKLVHSRGLRRALLVAMPNTDSDTTAADAKLAREFPLLLPDAEPGVLHGWLQVQGRDYRLRYRSARAGRAATLSGDSALNALLRKHGALAVLEQRLAQAQGGVYDFLVELRELLERLHRADESAAIASLDSVLYSRLIHEIGEIGWERVRRVEEAGCRFELGLELKDSANRLHPLNMQIGPDYPATAPRCAAALPVHVAVHWQTGPGQSSRLVDVVRQFAKAIDSFHGALSVARLPNCFHATLTLDVCDTPRALVGVGRHRQARLGC